MLALGERVLVDSRGFIERIAVPWEVPLIEPEKLGSFARALGNEVPAILRPVDPRN
jgi:hypothetical protein